MIGDRDLHIGILGGGLAGSFLAARLLENGCRVTLIDDEDPLGASRVAAGLFNVITGRFGAKTWMAEVLLDSLISFFEKDSYATLKSHLHRVPIYRPFKEPAEFNKWTGRVHEPAYTSLVRFQEEPILPGRVHNPLGGIWIESCGWLHTRGFLSDLKLLLVKQKGMCLVSNRLPYGHIDPHSCTVRREGEKMVFDSLVCCEGYHGHQNPFFSGVRLIPNKGELLVLEIPDLPVSFAISRKVYLIPLGEQRFLAGSTYQNSFDTLAPTQAGREAIEELLSKTLAVPFSVIDHFTGVRPTTPNRRPIVGRHPQHPHLFLFNGLGTKGVLQAPYFSSLLADMIVGKEVDIPKEANVDRFYKKK